MFTTARIKLTLWYLSIIMLISIMFSLAIYRILTNELDREASRISERYIREYGILPPTELAEPQIIQASEQSIKYSLVYVNVIIFIVAGVGGYILAGITLKPIKTMIDEQKRFIADASHELRTPITSLRSEIEVYLRSKKQTLQEANGILQSNLEEVNNLQVLSDRLIELAQYKETPESHTFAKYSLQTIVEQSIKKVQKTAKQKHIAIEAKLKEYPIEADANQLTELFSILLDNGVKYSPQNTTITVTITKADSNMNVTVSDQGMGIDAHDLPHIFDRFYRADNSRTKQKIPGYGLGLSIAKKIVEEHHGEISVKSTLQKGSTFTVTLPAKQA